jgi:hypothetical protein
MKGDIERDSGSCGARVSRKCLHLSEMSVSRYNRNFAL